jgi:ATP-dependent Clp protease ATP-binding subunit ClpC
MDKKIDSYNLEDCLIRIIAKARKTAISEGVSKVSIGIFIYSLLSTYEDKSETGIIYEAFENEIDDGTFKDMVEHSKIYMRLTNQDLPVLNPKINDQMDKIPFTGELSKIFEDARKRLAIFGNNLKLGPEDVFLQILKTDPGYGIFIGDIPLPMEVDYYVEVLKASILSKRRKSINPVDSTLPSDDLDNLLNIVNGIRKKKSEDNNESDIKTSGPMSNDDFMKMLGLSLGKSNENTSNEQEGAKLDNEFNKAGESKAIEIEEVDPNSKTPFLDKFSYDMTLAAKKGKYDPVVGRNTEIGQIIKIISCRKKNNAILLGDPGCGKTAIVELLAQKIVGGTVPFELLGKRICSLDLNALVSGTKYRGEYEERLQGIIKEVCKDKDIIVYIDEFHNLIGNGSTSGSGDGANILKPYLARGEFQCIGSTTQEEYRKFVKDGALKRRFQCVQINEPGIQETIGILKEIAPKYEEFHKVKYSNAAIKMCVELSGRYITDKFFPDKAIDILDTAGAQMKLGKKKDTKEIDSKKLQIEEEKKKKQKAVEDQNFEEAATHRDNQLSLQKELDSLMKEIVKKDSCKKSWPEVTEESICEVVSGITGIPVDQIGQSDLGRLKLMKKELSNKVIGQNEAVDTFVTILQRNFLGLRDETKCIASILLTGPSGTGKTLICEEVAKRLFGSQEAFIKFNMGEMTSEHEVSKLMGSPAGYIGYDDEPLLLQVKRHPSSLVLFDEIEKAHPKIFDIFLGIMDKGEITLNNGERVDFRNCIVVFTGNIGTKEIAKFGKGLGFNRDASDKNKTNTDIVKKSIKNTFRPEFINRLTNMVTFNELGKPELQKIFALEFGKLKDRLKSKGYTIKATNKLRDHIIDLCDPIYGARDLQRYIQDLVETNVCTKLLELDEKDLGEVNSIQADYVDDKVEISFPLPKKKEEKVEVKEIKKPSEEIKA